jgi:hypothetical protein
MSRTTNCIGHAIEAHFGPVIGFVAVSKTFESRAIALAVMALVPDTGFELRVYEVLTVKKSSHFSGK